MAAEQLQTFASDQKLFDQLFADLPQHYRLLSAQDEPAGRLKVFTLNAEVFFVLGQSASDAAQTLFGSTQVVMYLTPREVSQSRPDAPCVSFLPVTARNLEDIVYRALTAQLVEVSLYQIDRGQLVQTNTATPGNLGGMVEYCPRLLGVQTYKALLVADEDAAHGEQQLAVLFADNCCLNIVRLVDDPRGYQALLTCLFQCQVSEVAVVNQDGNETLQQVLELGGLRYELVAHTPEPGAGVAPLNVRVGAYFSGRPGTTTSRRWPRATWPGRPAGRASTTRPRCASCPPGSTPA